MSQENVELVRTVLAGWARGDFRANSDLFDAHFEWKQRPDAVEPGSHRGVSVGTALRQIFEVWEDYRIEAEEYIDAGDRIVVVGRARGTARASGLELDQSLFFLWTARDGKLASVELFRDRGEALEAVGRSE
jgi:ketosteroid isomerase-like protein